MPHATRPAALRGSPADAHTRLWAGYVALGLAGVGAYFALAGFIRVQDALYDLVGLAAVAAIVAGVRRRRVRFPAPWYLIAGGLLAYVLGDVSYSLYDLYLGSEPPYPYLADTFYLAGYPLLAAGMVGLLRRLDRDRGPASLIDAAIIAAAFAVAGWVFVMDPLYQADYPLLDRAIWIAYPSMDLLLLAVLARLLLTRTRATLAFRLLASAVLLQLGADVAYYGFGFEPSWLSACWLLSYVLWGAAALHPSSAWLSGGLLQTEARLTGGRLAVLACALLAGPAMLAALWVTGHEGHVVPVSVGAAVIAVLVLARLAGLVRAVERAHADERAARSRAEWSERLLADQNERLRELDRVKDEFVTLVSHELRTPLTSIMGYLDLLEEETDGLSEEQRRFLAVVERNAERLARLVEDLLFVARLQAGGLELGSGEVDLAAVAEKSVEAARPDAVLKSVELVLEAKSSKLTGDRLRLGQVLDNLVSNAVKFTPEGGRVTVRVSDGADGTLLEVADTGLGIPADEQERLFERFFRASTAATHAVPGTGLGLTVVKAIVEAHGGTIAVASEVGRGTTVRVNLPGVAGAAGTLAA